MPDILSVFFQIGFAGEFKLIIPLLAEMCGQRPFEKLIEPHPELASKLFGRLAYIPLVIVDGSKRRIFRQSHGIERTGGRFAERAGLTLVIRTLYGTLTQPSGA